MGLHVVEVEVLADWGNDDRLIELMEALTAYPELLEAVGTGDLHRRAISVTVTVEARDPATARAIAECALEEEIATLGFARVGEPRPLSFEEARRAHVEARKQEALEAMASGLAHPVTVEAVLDLGRPGAPGRAPGRAGCARGVSLAAGERGPGRAPDRRDRHGQGQDREGGAGDRHPGTPRGDGSSA